MIYFLSVIIGLYVLVSLVFIAVDVWHWLMERYLRYKIGRWQDRSAWVGVVYHKGIQWLPIVPTVPITHNTNLILLDMLQGKYKRQSVQVWQTGGLLLGVNAFLDDKSDAAFRATLKYFINDRGNWIQSAGNVDYGILGYAFLKNSKNSVFLKPAMDELLKLVLAHKGKDGLVAYSGRSSIRYVDTIGLVCPFLTLYGKTYNSPEIAELAVQQIEKYVEQGMFKDTWLPVHSYHVETGLPVGVYGWGRGTGWFVLGLIDTYLELEDVMLKQRLEKIIQGVAENLLKFQWKDGGFGIFLQLDDHYDSSATATLSYFYAQCFQIFGKEEYRLVVEKSHQKLMKFTRRDGALDYCQGDTVDVGIFSQRMDIMPFAQGMLLRSMGIYSRIMH